MPPFICAATMLPSIPFMLLKKVCCILGSMPLGMKFIAFGEPLD
jgi:hypothetical protein